MLKELKEILSLNWKKLKGILQRVLKELKEIILLNLKKTVGGFSFSLVMVAFPI